MSRIQFLYDNLIDRATLTPSSEALGFPALNLKNSFRGKPWRTAGSPAGAASVVFDLSALAQTVTGPNLLSNGDFSSGTTGWDANYCTLASVAGGQAGNCLELTRTSSNFQFAAFDTSQALTKGISYRISFWVKSGTSGNEAFSVYVHDSTGSSMHGGAITGTSSGTWTQYSVDFTCNDSISYLRLTKNTATAGTMLFDTVTIYELSGREIDSVALTGYEWLSAPGTLEIEFNRVNTWTAVGLTPFGPELVSNGGFASSTTDWVAFQATLASVAGGYSGNCLELTRTSGTTQVAYQNISGLTIGKKYRLLGSVESGTSGNETFSFGVAEPSLGSTLASVSGTSSGTWGTYGLTWTADREDIRVYGAKASATAGTMLFDQISFRELPTEVLTWSPSPTAGGNLATIFKKFTSKNYPYVRLNVVYSPGGTPTDWDLGNIFLGKSFEPERNYKYLHVQDLIDDSFFSRSVGGQTHVDEIEKYRRFTFAFNIFGQAQWNLFQKMMNHRGKSKDLFICFDDNESADMTAYGKFIELPQMTRAAINLFQANFVFEESR